MQLTGRIPYSETRLGMKQVEELLFETLDSSSGRFQEILNHLAAGPGKQIRPLLVLLSAGLIQPGVFQQPKINEAIIKVATAVELIHTASLVHDDVIDQSDLRRGLPSVHRIWGKPEAVMAGDFLMAGAFRFLGETRFAGTLIPLLARSVVSMCRGEVWQLGQKFNWGLTEQEYFHYNYLKTSQFIASCCEAGGRATGMARIGEIKALRVFGRKIGQAFQLIDDLLDFSENRQQVGIGKPVGVDLKQGLATLPLIYLLQNNKCYSQLCSRFVGAPLPRGLSIHLQQEIRRCGALNYTYRKASKLRQEALSALSCFPPSPYLSQFNELAGKLINRASCLLVT